MIAAAALIGFGLASLSDPSTALSTTQEATPADAPPTPLPEGSAAALDRIQDCAICPELVVLPAGRAAFGDTTLLGAAHERPPRSVALDYRLAVGRYEVTFAQWDACVREGGCAHRPDDLGWGRGRQPVIGVSFEDAQGYVQWLSRPTGHGYRHPSEAEWEYAARAGATGAFSFGATEAELCAFGNGADAASIYDGRYGHCVDGFPDRAAPVGSFAPNAFGLHDMAARAAGRRILGKGGRPAGRCAGAVYPHAAPRRLRFPRGAPGGRQPIDFTLVQKMCAWTATRSFPTNQRRILPKARSSLGGRNTLRIPVPLTQSPHA